jgi:hypothetical protein
MKAYTDIEQSKKLAEILPLESADMRYGYIAPYEFSDRMYEGGYDDVPYQKDFLKRNPNFSENEYDDSLPCWSLASLLDVLPNNENISTNLSKGGYRISTLEYTNNWFVDYEDETNGLNNCVTSADNPVDACYEMIIRLNELNLL